MLCDELGRLLTALPIYVNGVFGDDAIVGHITSDKKKQEYPDWDEILLYITILIRTYGRPCEDVKKDIEMLESLIYNPEKHSDYMLCHVYIGYEFYE